jgi:hypothetical protein
MIKRFYLIAFFILFFVASASGAETILFNDNFASGSLAGYDTNSGVWGAGTNQLVGGALDGSGLSHTVSGMTAGRSYRIYYRNDPSVASLNNAFFWFTDQNGIGNLNGYNVNVQSGIFLLRRFTNGSGTTLLSGAGISTGSMHDINISHAYDGNIQVWVDGVSKGSVIDTTYKSGSRIVWSTSNGAGNGIWDDVNVLFTGDTNQIFRIVDESNPALKLQATLTINGASWPVGVDGNFDVNSSISFPATITASYTGYSTRSFYFDSNAGLYENNRLGLRTSTQTQTVGFTFYGPDETTLLTNRIIVALKNGVVSGRIKTNSSGVGSMVLATQDNGYTFQIKHAGSDTNTQYTYTTATVSIAQPKNEENGVNIGGTFSIDIGGLGQQNISTSVFPYSTIFILSNTTSAYTARIQDFNGTGGLVSAYFPRNYVMQAIGDISSVSISPYLVPLTSGLLVNVRVVDLPTSLTVSGVRARIKTGVASVLQTVEEEITNALGVAQFSMLPSKNYDFAILSADGLTQYFPTSGNQAYITTADDDTTFKINYTNNNQAFNSSIITFNFDPKTETLIGASKVFDINISVNFDFNRIIVEAWDKNVLRNVSVSTTSPFNAVLNLNLSQFDGNIVIVRWIVEGPDSNTSFSKSYTIVGNTNKGVLNLTNLNQTLTPQTILVIIFIILLAVLFFLGTTFSGNSEAQIFPVAILGAVLVWVLLPTYSLYYMGALFVGGIAWLWTRSVR